MSVSILWFRNDLRVHDHAALVKAAARGQVIPVYCVDPRQFGDTPEGWPKTGPFRAYFLRQALADLRASLRRLGADLLVRYGLPQEVLPVLVRQTGATQVWASKEVTAEELLAEQQVEAALKPVGASLQLVWQSTLYAPDDLPFPLHALPNVFTQFRKEVERGTKVRPPLLAPQTLAALPAELEPGLLPDWPTPVQDPRAVMVFEGGEAAGMARVRHYLWETEALATYKETRNGLLGADYSSKFSPWLATGSLSPRWIYDQIIDFETKRIKNESTYWLIFELIWRDYFRLVARKFGTSLFHARGLQNKEIPRLQNRKLFEVWTEGRTGVPFIDANMRELKATGFMSNRGRQNVASFLVKDLRIDWRWGASWFESMLLDYDPCSNWGNWNYVAGIGNDPREDRYFNILRQAKQYDPKGDYVRHWLPELAALPASVVHQPGLLSRQDQQQYGLHLGAQYPHPIVSYQRWLQHSA